MQTKPLVSIIMLNWNGERYVHDCLKSVIGQDYMHVEIIIVDNASHDGSIQKLKQNFPNLKFIENKENLGYAKGMNQGISVAMGDFVVPLNVDVYLDRRFISCCIRRCRKVEKLGAIGGKVFAWTDGNFTSKFTSGGETYLKKRFQGGRRDSNEEILVFRPNGSFPFLSREMLDDIYSITGYYYDEKFITGWEDTDLFLRMQLRGWKCLFVPDAFGWHVGSAFSGGTSSFFAKPYDYKIRLLRNRYYALIKNVPIQALARLLPYLLLTELVLYPYLTFKSPKLLIALVKAQLKVLSNIFILFKERENIQKAKNVPNISIMKLFRGF